MNEQDMTFLHLGAHEAALSVMQASVLADGEGIPSALVVNAKGEGFPLAAMFIAPGDKDAFAARIRAEVRARDAVCVAFAAESWLTVTPAGAPLDTTPPSQSEGRLEVVAVHSEGRDGTILDSMFEIIRGAGGKVTGFEKLFRERRQRGDDPAAGGEVRFSGFFPADA